MNGMTRRDFLKGLGGAALALSLSPISPGLAAASELEDHDPVPPPASRGRVASWGVEIKELPESKAALIRMAKRDEVFDLREQVGGEALMPHNSVWFKTDEGYLYSSWVQPVEEIFNEPQPDQAAAKFWGELTVPLSDTRLAPDPQATRFMRVYYTGVFRVISAVMGKDDAWWYRLQEGITYGAGPYIPATHIRRIDPSELLPLSPEVTDKRIEVNLADQTIMAYEGDNPVLSSRVASGYGKFFTPRGKHSVLFKYPAVRMTGGTGNDFYDLPGVPFSTFFTWSGVAIHGTYWHNDYGRPRSHGCLNVPSPVARWFWRWTAPVAPYTDASYFTPRGATATVVNVA